MIQVTLNFPTILLAVAALQALDKAGIPSPVASITEAPGKPEKAAKTEPKTADKPTAQPEPKPTAAEKSETSSPVASQSPASGSSETLDYEKDVKPLVIKAGGVKGRDAVLALFGTFGVTKGPELKADQLAPAKAQLEALLATE
jgi:hypothetical protein